MVTAPGIVAPAGDVTLMFTDIEGSTKNWDKYQDTFRIALNRHNELLRRAIAECDGYEVKTIGDSFMVAFSTPLDAVSCALKMQQYIESEPFPEIGGMRVRIGLHTGVVNPHGGDYLGPPVNRAARIESSAHGGQTVMSEDTARHVEACLPPGARLVEAGLHRLKDLGAPLRLYLLSHEALPAREYPPLRTMDGQHNNFPAQVTSFIGREREIAEINRLLRVQKSRLISLIGPGGTGKTRLAMQVAAESMQEYPDGIWLVELASLSDPRELPTALALALKMELKPDTDARQQICQSLRDKRALIVFDNFEHLNEAASFVAELLRECRNLAFLVTTQHLLQISGEQEYPVPPLELPPRRVTLSDAMNYCSIRLFVERAESAKQGFAITEENLPAIAEICRQLDGVPLAVELTAALVRAMSPQQLLPRMKDRFKLLASARRDLEPRQRSLRGAMDWSWDLLNEDERMLFQEISIFAGGCFLEDVEAVCSAPDAFLLIFSLRDKSLLRVGEEMGESHFTMLESLRAYGQEKLGQSSDSEGPRDAHARHYLQKAQQLNTQIRNSGDAMQRMEIDIDNMRAGMDWAERQQDYETVSAYGDALARFLRQRGLYAEIDTRLPVAETAARQTGNRSLLARLLNHRGLAVWNRHNLDTAEKLFTESCRISEELGERDRVLVALTNLGNIAFNREDMAEAQKLYGEALQLSTEIEGRPFEGNLWMNLGTVAYKCGNMEEATRHYEESLAIHRRNGDEYSAAWVLYNFAEPYQIRKEYDRALKLLEESRQIFAKLGHRRGTAAVAVLLATVLLEKGQPDKAVLHAEESRSIAEELGDRVCHMNALIALGRIRGATVGLEPASKLFRQAFAIAEELGKTTDIVEILYYCGKLLAASACPERAYLLLSIVAREYAARGQANANGVEDTLLELRSELSPGTVAELDATASARKPGEALREL